MIILIARVEILDLRFSKEMEIPQIAERLGINKSTALKRLERARKRLDKVIQGRTLSRKQGKKEAQPA
ncbi:MAG: sigma-70 family RNA polymerase sigma factor [Chloroflexi bacterium]|nr:sigma-70 family RNA polymerase sigma factor [Chloroflexota bacterium]